MSDTLMEQLREDGYEDMADELEEYYKNAIWLCDLEDVGDIPVGASKIGGAADLPPEIEYPWLSEYTMKYVSGTLEGETEHYERSALQLLAQINCRELAESGADLDGILPKTGMLYIFWGGEWCDIDKFGANIETEIADPDHTAMSRVIYWDGDMSVLRRVEPPYPPHPAYFDEPVPERAVEFSDSDEYDECAVDEIPDLEEAADVCAEDLSCGCVKMLGIPYGSMNKPEIPDDEVCLFQFDHSHGCMWYEYWMISREDLANRDFSNVRFGCDCD